MLQKLLFRIAKSPVMGTAVGNAFRYLSAVLPVHIVFNSKQVIAFHHPQPCYDNHLILSPRKAIRNLQCMASDSTYFEAIFQAAQHIGSTLPQYHTAYTLMANGGRKQEVQQVHFHMFTGHEMVSACSVPNPEGSCLYRDETICIFPHPNPGWTLHFIVSFRHEYQPCFLNSLLKSIDLLHAEYDIVHNGYSLVYEHHPSADALPVFHIISGKMLH